MRRFQLVRSAMAVVAVLAILAACNSDWDSNELNPDELFEEDSWLSEQRPYWSATVAPAFQPTPTAPHSLFTSVSVGGGAAMPMFAGCERTAPLPAGATMRTVQ